MKHSVGIINLLSLHFITQSEVLFAPVVNAVHTSFQVSWGFICLPQSLQATALGRLQLRIMRSCYVPGPASSSLEVTPGALQAAFKLPSWRHDASSRISLMMQA